MFESSGSTYEDSLIYCSTPVALSSHSPQSNSFQDNVLPNQLNNFSTPHSKYSQNLLSSARITSNHYTDIDEAIAGSVDGYGLYAPQESRELVGEETNLIYADEENWNDYRDSSTTSMMESDLESDTVEDDYGNDDLGIIRKAEVARLGIGNAYRRSLSGGGYSSGSSGGIRVASIGSSSSGNLSITRNMTPAEIAQHHFKLAQQHLEAAQRATMQVARQNSIQAQEYSTAFETTRPIPATISDREIRQSNYLSNIGDTFGRCNSNQDTPRSSSFPQPSPSITLRDSPPLSPPLSAESNSSGYQRAVHTPEKTYHASSLNRSTSRGYRKPVPKNLLSDGMNFEIVTSALNDLSRASPSPLSLSTPSTPTSFATSWKEDNLPSKFSSTTISVEGSRSTGSIPNSEPSVTNLASQEPMKANDLNLVQTKTTRESTPESRSGSSKFSFFSRGKSSSRPNSNSSLQTPPRTSPVPKISPPIQSLSSPPRSTKTSPISSRPTSVHSISTTHSNSNLSSSMQPRIRFLSPSRGSDKSETSSLDIREYTEEERAELGRKRDEARKAMQESFKMLM